MNSTLEKLKAVQEAAEEFVSYVSGEHRKPVIVYGKGTNRSVVGGQPVIRDIVARALQALATLDTLIAEQEKGEAICPYIVTSKGGTSHCRLAEQNGSPPQPQPATSLVEALRKRIWHEVQDSEFDTGFNLAKSMAIALVRQHTREPDVEATLRRATEILTNFKEEGKRTKYDELEPAYAMLFKQLVDVISKQSEREVVTLTNLDRQEIEAEICYQVVKAGGRNAVAMTLAGPLISALLNRYDIRRRG